MDSAWLADQLRAAEADGGIVVLEEGQGGDPILEFAHAVAHGLSDDPKWLDCRFLYDEAGSAIFERICETPEYYPTRTEAAILRRHAEDIAEVTGPVRLVELGSGSSIKTQHVLRAYLEQPGGTAYVPIDVSRSALEGAQSTLEAALPDVNVAPIHGTYDDAFPVLQTLSPTLILFLGSTIGNFNEEEAAAFWPAVGRNMSAGDYFLLGADLEKDVGLIEAAYNDTAGHTEAFTRNLFSRMNRELDAGITVEDIEHVARYNRHTSRIETYARFTSAQTIHVEPLDTSFRIGPGELIQTEISRKFRLADLIPRLAGYGLATRRVFTDDRDWFALLLLEKDGALAG